MSNGFSFLSRMDQRWLVVGPMGAEMGLTSMRLECRPSNDALPVAAMLSTQKGTGAPHPPHREAVIFFFLPSDAGQAFFIWIGRASASLPRR